MRGLILNLHKPRNGCFGIVWSKALHGVSYLRTCGDVDGYSFEIGKWIDFNTPNPKDRGICKLVRINNEVPWTRVNIHDWQKVVTLKGRLCTDRIVCEVGNTRYYEDPTLGPVRIPNEFCHPETDILFVHAVKSRFGEEVYGSSYTHFWTVTYSEPRQPSEMFLREQKQKEDKRSMNQQNMAVEVEQRENVGYVDQEVRIARELNYYDHDHDEMENHAENRNREFLEEEEPNSENEEDMSEETRGEDSDSNSWESSEEEPEQMRNTPAHASSVVQRQTKLQNFSAQEYNKGNSKYANEPIEEKMWFGWNSTTFLNFSLVFIIMYLLSTISAYKKA